MPLLSVRARYENGVLTPLDPLNLSEGCEVTVDVSIDDDNSDATSETKTANPRILEIIDEIRRDFPNAFSDLPHDGSKNYKHYLYGQPRDED